MQGAPLADGMGSDGRALDLYVLVGGGLVESFLNRRAVLSSWVPNAIAMDAAINDRVVFLAPAPPGVQCTFAGWALMALAP